MANGLAYLPSLTNDQLKDLQTAMNASIRAILQLPKYGHLPMSEYRAMLGLESIETIRDKIVAVEAWKRRQNLVNLLATEGRATRSRNKLNIPGLRTAAYVLAINKVARAYTELGIFP